MSRRQKHPDWTPNPECDAAWTRAIATAHQCAAVLLGEEQTDEPQDDASPEALLYAIGMLFFLARLAPGDLAALCTGPGSLADLPLKPFRARALRTAPLARLFAG